MRTKIVEEDLFLVIGALVRDLLTYGFLRNAVLAVLVGSSLTGLVSPIVVYKRMEFIGDGLAHAIFAGVALAVLLDFSVMVGAVLATLVFAIMIFFLSRSKVISENSAVGMLLPVFMSAGILLFSKSSSYTTDVTSYLFGNVLMVTTGDILFATLTLLGTIAFLLFSFYDVSYWIFDEDMARFYGVRTRLIKALTILLISFTVVSVLKIAGVVVMGAFLVLPGIFGKLRARSFAHATTRSVVFNVTTSLLGFLAAYYADLPPGPTIALLSFLALGLALLIGRSALSQKTGA